MQHVTGRQAIRRGGRSWLPSRFRNPFSAGLQVAFRRLAGVGRDDDGLAGAKMSFANLNVAVASFHASSVPASNRHAFVDEDRLPFPLSRTELSVGEDGLRAAAFDLGVHYMFWAAPPISFEFRCGTRRCAFRVFQCGYDQCYFPAEIAIVRSLLGAHRPFCPENHSESNHSRRYRH